MTTVTSTRTQPYRLADPGTRIAPSLLSVDFGRVKEQIADLETAGLDLLHLDVMDGHFVPNISFGIPVIESIRPLTNAYFDTHLMITDPLKYAEPFVKAGSNNITFHIEVTDEPQRVIDEIRSLGADVGISLNPDTPPSAIESILDQIDMVLVMSVWPGFGGQTFIESSLDKVRQLRSMLRPDQRLEIDGGVNAETIQDCVQAGADVLVCGSAVFRADKPSRAMVGLRELVLSASGK
jgi:ribulose-phosphate 3-epimerase